MATLAALQWQAVVPKTRELLAILGRMPPLRPFYLGGGTALALRLGHRISQDLDLFANIENLTDDLRRDIVAELHREHAVTILQDSPLGLVIEVDGLAMSYFTYGYPLLAPTDSVSGIEIAGLMDIGLMKLDALMGRGMRKDFYDVYFVAPHIPLDELVARWEDKYSYSRGLRMRLLTALVDFSIADQQQDPIVLAPVSWGQVKSFCEAEARRLSNLWFAQTDSERS